MLISSIKQYNRPIFRSHCNVIDDNVIDRYADISNVTYSRCFVRFIFPTWAQLGDQENSARGPIMSDCWDYVIGTI